MPTWLRALFYMVIVGGGWLIILPVLILFLEYGSPVAQTRSSPFLAAGSAMVLSGVVLALISGYYLVTQGRGTPFPLDPTRHLVTIGPYAYVRNPQAIAMTLMVIGEILAVQSSLLWLLFPFTLVYLEIFAAPWEERQLLKQYGDEYARYHRMVGKWIPSRWAYHAPSKSI